MAAKQQTMKMPPSQMSEHDVNKEKIDTPKAVEEPRIVPSAVIDELWNAQDPNAKAQELFLSYLSTESAKRNEDLNKWDDCESRFEPNELKWIANFNVDNLVFCKTKACIADESCMSAVIQLLWEVLDLFGQHDGDLDQQTANRYKHLSSGLKKLYEEKALTSAQVGQLLEHARQDVFGHMQLYLSCIGMKKQQVHTKAINLFQEMPQVCESPNLSTDCRELIDEQPMEHKPQSEQKVEEVPEQEVEQEDIVDPEDPMYGIDQRLKSLQLDDESTRIIKEKLQEAQGKIKLGLEQRQANLDAKINAAPPGKKK